MAVVHSEGKVEVNACHLRGDDCSARTAFQIDELPIIDVSECANRNGRQSPIEESQSGDGGLLHSGKG